MIRKWVHAAGDVPREVVVVHRSGGRRPSPPAAGDGPPEAVLDVVTNCPLPSLLLAVPSEQILAASGVAERLLCPDDGSVVGRNLEDFTADEPTGALDLMVAGRLDGYEARRSIHRGDRTIPVTVWIRLVDGREGRNFALAKLLPDPGTLGETLRRLERTTADAVVGSTDAHLTVDRVSTDVVTLLDHRTADVVGQSLFRLVDTPDVTPLLKALARSSDTGLGTSLLVRPQLFGFRASRCEMLLLPMEPSPSFAFALLDEESAHAPTSALDMEQALWQFEEVLRSATASRLAAELPADPGLSRLSGRELEIVMRLLNGDRVRAIAESLFLSPSTVRNHLSAVFRKLRVGSQQELIHLLRRTDGPSSQP
jgi:DNA-binding CsgD family transcriptional regulator